MRLYNDRCENILPTLEADTIEAMVCDPPGAINFMCKKWDSDMGGRDNWIEYMAGIFRECLRVLKPGAHALVWAIPRTSHWTATALENAGFEVRDVVNHIFGSGFPKSLAIGKAIDKMAGAERTIIGKSKTLISYNRGRQGGNDGWKRPWNQSADNWTKSDITIPATESAQQWEGWGTALKPACEHWILVRKPLGEKTVAANVLAYGVGGINVDGCRVPLESDCRLLMGGTYGGNRGSDKGTSVFGTNKNGLNYVVPESQGRFPANVVLSYPEDEYDAAGNLLPNPGKESVLAGFPNTISKGHFPKYVDKSNPELKYGQYNSYKQKEQWFDDSGSAARFFYCAKASKSDRNEGCEDFFWHKLSHNDTWHLIPEKKYQQMDAENIIAKENNQPQTHIIGKGNNHPTVKSTELMRYLCRLITPLGGTVLDPFMGSGSTGKAAVLEGFNFIGIEQDAEYFRIAEARIGFVLNQKERQESLKL